MEGDNKPDPKPEGGDNKPDPKPDPDKTFTQADLDRIVQDRLRRESSKYADYDDLKAKADKLKEIEDKDKSESQKLQDELAQTKAAGEKTAIENLRLEVALDKAPEGMSAAEVRKYAKRLKGATREELEKDAEEFFADFDTSGEGKKPPTRKPSERMKSGGGGEEEEPEVETSKVLAKVPRL